MTAILGLNAFHPDSSACLVIDGKLIAAISEERLGNRYKHTRSFPVNAIIAVLKIANISFSDITHVAIAKSPYANMLAKIKYTLNKPSIGLKSAVSFIKQNTEYKYDLDNIADLIGSETTKNNYEKYFVEHHIAHIASSYYVSDFENAAGFSYDGSGDFVSAMSAICNGTKIKVLEKVALPNSLGHFYTAMCQFIGFDLFGEEYKVMGLAPYGDDLYEKEMNMILDIKIKIFLRIIKFFSNT